MWRFVQISDPHLASQRDGIWNNNFLCTMMPDVMLCLKRDLAKIQPEFILATGDIVSNQSRDAVFAARDLMDSLGFPYYPMGGNHDFVGRDSRSWFIEAYHAQLPAPRPWYSFDHNELHFCVLDAWWQWSDGTLSEISEATIATTQYKNLLGAFWALPPHMFEWLEQDLSANRDKKTIVSCHYPAIPIPERMRRPDMNDGGYLQNGAELVELLDGHPQVKALFCGHVHMHYIERVRNVTHVITAALPEYPTEFREIEVHDDRLEIFTRGLSDTSFARRSLIPGKNWTSGTLEDRRATISLV